MTWSFNRVPGKGTAYVLLHNNDERGMVSLLDTLVWPDIVMRGICDLLEQDEQVGP
jgi:hypothetical protein